MSLYQVVDSDPFTSVEETASKRHVATFGPIAPLGHGHRERAQAYAEHLNREHADGRVPQSTCSQREPVDPKNPTAKPPRVRCDFDRVNDWSAVTDEQMCSVVLCDYHSEKVCES